MFEASRWCCLSRREAARCSMRVADVGRSRREAADVGRGW